jgi:hypothetical protein
VRTWGTRPVRWSPRFAFLIGRWKFDAKFKLPDGEWQTFHGTWLGHYILDGYAIADEYRMIDSSGELIVFGMNFRIYDSAKQVWNTLSSCDSVTLTLKLEGTGLQCLI